MQCDQCLHVTFTMNQLYLVGGPVPLHCAFSSICNRVGCLHVTFTMNQLYLVGGASTVALCIFLYMQSCWVTAISYVNLTNSPLLLNGYLESIVSGQGGPGIIALHSFLYLQSCWVTAFAFGISHCRISLTNLPLLLHVWYMSYQFAAVGVHRCHLLDWEG